MGIRVTNRCDLNKRKTRTHISVKISLTSGTAAIVSSENVFPSLYLSLLIASRYRVSFKYRGEYGVQPGLTIELHEKDNPFKNIELTKFIFSSFERSERI